MALLNALEPTLNSTNTHHETRCLEENDETTVANPEPDFDEVHDELFGLSSSNLCPSLSPVISVGTERQVASPILPRDKPGTSAQQSHRRSCLATCMGFFAVCLGSQRDARPADLASVAPMDTNLKPSYEEVEAELFGPG